ncbi:hypothetical protein QBL02_03840 [Leucobacter sp. UT-8R-CII-1-4]|uniref:S10 family serine carboxypeptidase-like protein n=1 Tax=Leucobacter sp. UT-8R-CII-1-4 TaxID=3040075 RepID=UPI0024A7DCB4|nr:hypothetical protein [Leucobacter sp. UT-8R-CII-1-4]MDI6022672.1 hypothetical protein [Leucobacter sp. UT-8R-CII-1-4]
MSGQVASRWGLTPAARPLAIAAGQSCEARWQRLELLGATGATEATISGTSYTLPGEGRPVLFLWNGGPGASSSPLHMNAFGPMLLKDGTPVPNPDTLLREADLVFIDPIGTGFSRLLDGSSTARWLSSRGDAEAVSAFVHAWLALHDRDDATVHLAGESYGGFRLGNVLPLLADLSISSLTFISPLIDATANIDAPGNDLPYVFQLPTMAVAAWHHGAGVFVGRETTAAEVWGETQEFAQREYLPALYRGDGIGEAEAARVADRLAEYLGVTSNEVRDQRLRVDSEWFLRRLLADEGQLVGRLDTRITGPLPEPHPEGRPPAADDPALGIGRSNVILSAPIEAYLRDIVGAGAQADERYVSLSLDLNFAWDWRPETPYPPQFSTSVTRQIAEAAKAHPNLGMLLTGGYFDLATTLASTVHAFAHAGLADECLRVLPLVAGHSIDGEVRAQVRQAIAEQLAGG